MDKMEHITYLMQTYIPETAGKLVETSSGMMYASKGVCLSVEFDNMDGMMVSISTETFYAKYVTCADKRGMRKAVKWLAYMAS